jgi:hypothetical protein
MRAVATFAVAIVLSYLVAYAAEIALGIAFNAQEELIVAMIAQIVFVLLCALVLAIAVALGAGSRGITIVAACIVLAGFLCLAGLEAFALIDEDAALAPSDLPLLTEAGIPALLTVLVQWWLVRRYLIRRGARRLALAAEPTGG